MKNKTLLILVLVMIVNALSYGIMVPLMYPYASKFGLSAFGLGLLFSSFSFFQFIATPIMGRISDRFGRKPMLVLSLLGTSFSLALFAMAKSIPMLFIARILDGITGGNNSVAQAMLSDTSKGKNRTKAFGLLGASYGLGFMIGPALGGLLSNFGLATPFWFASIIALTASIMAQVFLRETLEKSKSKLVKREGLFGFSKLKNALTEPIIGILLLTSFFSSTAHTAFIIGFQTFSVDILKLSAQSIGLIFTAIGLLMIVMQSVGISWLLKTFKSEKKILRYSFLLTGILMTSFFFQRNIIIFIISNMAYITLFSPQMVLLPGLISKQSREEDQGGILGLNQSYISLGQIIGPALAGSVTLLHSASTFIVAGFIFILSAILVTKTKEAKKADL